MLVEVHNEKVIVGVTHTDEGCRRLQHLGPARRHATAIIEYKTNRRRALFFREGSQLLRLALIADNKVPGFQLGYRFPVFRAYRYIDHDLGHIHAHAVLPRRLGCAAWQDQHGATDQSAETK
jgi:hypothetical protein